MTLMNREKGEIQAKANQLLVSLQNNTDTWTKVSPFLFPLK